MKKPTKIVISFLFILLFVSMISTAIYMSFAEKTQQQTQTADKKTEQTPKTETQKTTQNTQQTPENTEQLSENIEQTPEDMTEETPQIDWTQFSTTDFYDGAFPKIGVCAVTAAIGENILSAFEHNIPEHETMLYYDTIENNIQNLLSGEYDIILSPFLSDDLLSLQQQYYTELELIPIANEAIVFLVSNKNSLQNLYLEDIQNIYSGSITNWENFTREEENIVAYQKPENSLIQYLFYSFVLSKDRIMTPPHQIKQNENRELEKVTSYYDGGEYAIGYDTYYYAYNILFDYNIKMLAIDGIYPTKRNIKRGIYPIMTNYYAIVRTNSSTNSPERNLVQYLISPTGQQLIEQSGYIPLN
ncbi:substrate-binding domain-containing protein [Clostridium sp. MD294]|uniref:PstS family phosphate ABC transporter substrate-binding protein n=1 Tax=Clostridium sp. MD294 TaxID=97138 RepID=UPI0002CAC031|nr:substrate-binding domain-containing protein [Clostridium sp. MD294]NDO46032.1 hypothetical protein [Clostridium sp. MD294]USF30304.1 hypothetical protein C820_001745 [Clostridium sp. MD294]